MNKLTPIFIGSALLAAAGLSYAQAQMGGAEHGGHSGIYPRRSPNPPEDRP